MILILDLTDPMLPVLHDEFVSPIIRLVKQLSGSVFSTHLSDLIVPSYPISGIIICGTALADTWYKSQSLEPVFKRWNAPILGICAGMQILVCESGGKCIPSLEIGMEPITLTSAGKEDTLTRGKGDFSGYALHQYTTTIPESWIVLAVSKNGPEIVKSTKSLRYGILFHPEVRNEWIIERFITITQDI